MNPVFIVGQWKCGTTWLLNILAAHPDVLAQDEIDIVRCVYDWTGTGWQPAPRSEWTKRFFNLSGWSLYYDASGWKNTDTVALLERGESLPRFRYEPTRPQKLSDLAPQDALALFAGIRDAATPEACLDAFVHGVCHSEKPATTVAFKAADQTAAFDILHRWQPEAKKLVVTRDGRDAAISAFHFERLMREKGAPWVQDQQELDYWSLLAHWAQRVDMFLPRARAGDVRVIRYEDLTNAFEATMRPVLEWLGLDASDATLALIRQQASFEKKAGRPRGTEAKSEMRKGVTAEWVDALSRDDKARAWTVAGPQLAALGYTADGPLGALTIAGGAA